MAWIVVVVVAAAQSQFEIAAAVAERAAVRRHSPHAPHPRFHPHLLPHQSQSKPEWWDRRPLPPLEWQLAMIFVAARVVETQHPPRRCNFLDSARATSVGPSVAPVA